LKIQLQGTYLLIGEYELRHQERIQLSREQVERIHDSEGHLPEELRDVTGRVYKMEKESAGLRNVWYLRCQTP
jgi:hypothetical protein